MKLTADLRRSGLDDLAAAVRDNHKAGTGHAWIGSAPADLVADEG